MKRPFYVTFYLAMLMASTLLNANRVLAQYESYLPCLENYQPFDESVDLAVVRTNLKSRIQSLKQMGKSDKALDYLCKAAASGISEAELFLGALCGEGGAVVGLEVEQDEKQARYWFDRAVNKKNTEAKLYLSNLLLEARGGPMDVPKGIQLLYEAATEGNPEAQFLLACEYYLGRHIIKDLNEAIRWAKLSDQNGYKKAKTFLEGMQKR